MKIRLLLLPIVLSSASVLVKGEDLPLQHSVRRLEYIHFDTVNQSIGWGVSQGTINPEDTFVPKPGSMTLYSINLRKGVTNHDGEEGQMSLRASEDASRVVEALALWMQSYTDQLDRSGNLHRPGSQDDLDPSRSPEDSPAVPLSRIAAQCPTQDRFRSARTGNLATTFELMKEASFPQNVLQTDPSCAGWPICPEIQEISFRSSQ